MDYIGALNWNYYMPFNMLNFRFNNYTPLNMFNNGFGIFNFGFKFKPILNLPNYSNNLINRSATYTNSNSDKNYKSLNIFSGAGFDSFEGKKVNTFTAINPIVKTNSSATLLSSNNLRQSMVNKAKSYVGIVNSSYEGNRLFSPKGFQNTSWYKQYGKWGWCCDFAVHCAKSALGSKYPKDMITSSPIGLVKAASKHNAYLQVPNANKISWLKSNVAPGDIIYMKGRGVSGKHIAVVDHVGDNGKIYAVSGNSGGGKVKSVTYDINTSGIYGFVSLDKIA